MRFRSALFALALLFSTAALASPIPEEFVRAISKASGLSREAVLQSAVGNIQHRYKGCEFHLTAKETVWWLQHDVSFLAEMGLMPKIHERISTQMETFYRDNQPGKVRWAIEHYDLLSRLISIRLGGQGHLRKLTPQELNEERYLLYVVTRMRDELLTFDFRLGKTLEEDKK